MNVTSPKISHATPQQKCTAKPLKGSVKAGASLVSASDDVPFMSNDEKNCGVEKNKTITAAMQVCLHDILTLKKTPLRRRYRKEANAHRNMLSRRGKVGAVVHPAFWKFDSFLRHVGPIPAHKATLDRINNNDPEYAPGKVRWADKRTQNSNKGDSLVFCYSRTGDGYTSSRLAKLQGVTPNTIRTRYHRGWSDDEIIEGRRHRTNAQAQPPKTTVYIPPASPRMVPQDIRAADILAHRRAETCRHSREVDGVEYFLATPEDLHADEPATPMKDLMVRQSMQKFMASKFPNWWKQYKPFIHFHLLEKYQQELIRQIDPDYVTAQECSRLRDSL